MMRRQGCWTAGQRRWRWPAGQERSGLAGGVNEWRRGEHGSLQARAHRQARAGHVGRGARGAGKKGHHLPPESRQGGWRSGGRGPLAPPASRLPRQPAAPRLPQLARAGRGPPQSSAAPEPPCSQAIKAAWVSARGTAAPAAQGGSGGDSKRAQRSHQRLAPAAATPSPCCLPPPPCRAARPHSVISTGWKPVQGSALNSICVARLASQPVASAAASAWRESKPQPASVSMQAARCRQGRCWGG